MRPPLPPRALTIDERKAAEAAFEGRPFQPHWSQAAKVVYNGIRAQLSKSPDSTLLAPQAVPDPPNSPAFTPVNTENARPLQAWHLQLTEPQEQLLLLLPWHVPLPSVLQYLEQQYPKRVFTLQAIEGGQHPCHDGHSLILARPIITPDRATGRSERR